MSSVPTPTSPLVQATRDFYKKLQTITVPKGDIRDEMGATGKYKNLTGLLPALHACAIFIEKNQELSSIDANTRVLDRIRGNNSIGPIFSDIILGDNRETALRAAMLLKSRSGDVSVFEALKTSLKNILIDALMANFDQSPEGGAANEEKEKRTAQNN